ncbi:MAG TPA: TIGR02281 family clan AA aspartic protease [Methylobacterium sp.]|jgi:aspartyl protease family protein|uniref:retropepsin-like aspartic protease family protein n=1 Tax=Methylorubrum sp. B1-46 TaxID=2897334 RepID=UPI001E33117F|nr:TIGR02281 family clan AA aspartic protease [Methylorubrum sp. B1-46]UGB26858.1 TIGR02281 family clan AA aspartic protease [Methylorubrum sp. B1-46]HEV2541320.1 TIGR02281 family clan AA aspartic protease [Methylobacterium sp.]
MMWAGLAILGIGLVVLIANHDGGPVMGLDSDQVAGLVSATALLLLLTAGRWRQALAMPGRTVSSILIWLAIGAVIVIGYTYRNDAQQVGANVVGALRPGTAVLGPGGEVTITRRSDGDFSVLATVNGGAEERFVFDTGASSVVLTAATAERLGIRPPESAFTQRVSTANGTALTAPIRLDAITVGPITERNVDAMVSRPGALTTNLLGQSFLDRLPSYEVRGDRLILRGR